MIKVIFQDSSILVLDKPAGLISMADQNFPETTLTKMLQTDFNIDTNTAGLVHRLDRDTSGVIVAAKDEASFINLQNQFKDRRVKKEYLALVHGVVEKSGIVNVNLGRNPSQHHKFTVIEDGRESATEYEPLKRLQFTGDRLREIFADFNKIQFRKLSTVTYNLFTLLRCKPLTGRTHQIRVHLKHINHPIVSDETYGGRKTSKLDLKWCPRQFLHAAKIAFYHPVSGELMEFESKLAEDLEKVLKLLVIND